MGPDANTLGTLSNPYLNPTVANNGSSFPGPYYYGNVGGSDFAIRQAYIALRTPIANAAIDWKLGVFDSPLGYESTSSPSNPNYTHSYGYTIEPTELTGLEATYKVNDNITLQAGIANVAGPMINQRAFIYYEGYDYYNYPVKAESYKTYFGAVTLTAPQNWGWAAGSTLSGGVLNGYATGNSEYGGTQTSWYLGATLATPVKGLKVGASLDYLNVGNTANGSVFNGEYNYYMWATAVYANYQYNDKLSFAGRFDHGQSGGGALDSLTGDVQYNLWANVITRLEARWDHTEHGRAFGDTIPYYENYYGAGYSDYEGNYNEKENAFTVALQAIYQF
jgi:hypothetical protein